MSEITNDLVILKKDTPFTDSLVIAQGTGITHKKLKRTIRKYKTGLEKFGRISVPHGTEIKKDGPGRPEEIYLLNEQQATFLITLLKNTEQVIEFKAKLVSEFYKMRCFLAERRTATWQETRRLGKLTRRSETDAIKQLVEYAKAQGSQHADKLYMIYSKLANKYAGITSRDETTIMQLNRLAMIEGIIANVIAAGIAAGRHYKEIYLDCKARLEMFADVAYLDVA